MFSKTTTKTYTNESLNQIESLRKTLDDCDAVIIGASLDYRQQQALNIPENDLKSIFLILRKSTDSMIGIVVDFIRFHPEKSSGHIGADISLSIAIRKHRIQFMIIS